MIHKKNTNMKKYRSKENKIASCFIWRPTQTFENFLWPNEFCFSVSLLLGQIHNPKYKDK